MEDSYTSTGWSALDGDCDRVRGTSGRQNSSSASTQRAQNMRATVFLAEKSESPLVRPRLAVDALRAKRVVDVADREHPGLE